MTATVWTLRRPLDDQRRRELVYRGDLLVFTGVEPMRELCRLVDGMLRDAFGSGDPATAQFDLDRDTYLSAVTSLQKAFRSDAAARRLMFAVFERVGVELGRTFWDWLHLRVLPDGGGHTGRGTSRMSFHRDTWSSNVYAQTNWWAPICPLTPERTIAFYPRYWHTVLNNNSAEWDLRQIRKDGANAPLSPEPVERVDTSDELRLVPEPGDVVCFSGAHLHAGVPNDTGLARFSIEVRTVDAEDAATGRGAPNIDGMAPHVASAWFRHAQGSTPLTEIDAPR